LWRREYGHFLVLKTFYQPTEVQFK
jgi:hypothetical protein